MQEFGLEILYFLDGLEAQRQEQEALRRALLSSGVPPHVVYPEYFPEQTGEGDAVTDTDETVFDYSAVKWESPSDKGIEEFERLQDLMRAHQHVSVGGGSDEEFSLSTEGFVSVDDSEWI